MAARGEAGVGLVLALALAELFQPCPARAATSADDDPSSRSSTPHNSSRSNLQLFPPQSRARLPRYAHAPRRACTSLGLLLVGIRQVRPRLEARRPRPFGHREPTARGIRLR